MRTITKGDVEIPESVCRRIVEFYKTCPENPDDLHHVIWRNQAAQYHGHLHGLLCSGNAPELSKFFRILYETSTLIGMDCTTGELIRSGEHLLESEIASQMTMAAYASGALRVQNPTQADGIEFEVEQIAERAESIGVKLGIKACMGMRGIMVGDRFVNWRIAHHFPVVCSIRRLIPSGGTVVELCSGIGFLGSLICQVENISYHTCDLGIASSINAVLASVNMGSEMVWLSGEAQNNSARIFIHGPRFPNVECSLIVNQDSFPELPQETQNLYLKEIVSRLKIGGMFLSINQESLAGEQRPCHTAIRANQLPLRLIYRCPYWSRSGYVEECWVRE